MTYKLTLMDEEQRPAVMEFLARNFPEGEGKTHPGWLSWQTDNPYGSHVQLCLQGDEIAALSVFLPTTFICDGKAVTGAFSVSTMVAPAHRRKGLGKQIHASRLDSFDFALSSGQSPANQQLYKKLGFSVLGTYRYMLVVKRFPEPVLSKKYAHELLSWLKFRGPSSIRKSRLSVRVLDALPAEIPEAFFHDRMPADDVMCPVHSPEYLRWRYANHPYFRYEFAGVFRGSELCGIAVYRKQGREAILVDLYGRSADLSAVARSVVDSVDADRVYCRFVGAPIAEALNRAGCYTHTQGTTYMGHSRHEDLLPLLTSRQWCLFMGDSDQDR